MKHAKYVLVPILLLGFLYIVYQVLDGDPPPLPAGSTEMQCECLDSGGILPEYSYVAKAKCSQQAFDAYVVDEGYVLMGRHPVYYTRKDTFPTDNRAPAWWDPLPSVESTYVKMPAGNADAMAHIKYENGYFYYFFNVTGGKADLLKEMKQDAIDR
jgi:hypothetical protein